MGFYRGRLVHLDVDQGTAQGGEICVELRLTNIYCAVVLYLKMYLARFILRNNQKTSIKTDIYNQVVADRTGLKLMPFFVLCHT